MEESHTKDAVAAKVFAAEAPSTNIQAPEKVQTMKLQERRRFNVCCLVLGVSLDVGAWCLEFNAPQVRSVFLWSLELGIWSFGAGRRRG
ncbi:MAG: hypothetical protein DME97_01870 [Verrucomicrobia bacterium]|nr:MAG: hypothetical protein DME97_01870 [Verrucomicrobiota bacterium]